MSLIINVPRGIDRIMTAAQRRVRMVFFGTPSFAVSSLRRLYADGWPVALVVTAPDKPTGRRRDLTPSPVRTAATEYGIAVETPATLKDEYFWRLFSELRPDVCIVAAYGKLIPERLLEIPRLGFLNVHPSLLPLYRGPSPIQTAILDGATTTGVSIMLLDKEMDHGPIVAQEPWTIPSGFDARACEAELAGLGAALLSRTLPGYADGTIVPRPQDHSLATFTHKFTREDGRLVFSRPARDVYNRIRALAVNPGAWTVVDGATLNILSAHIEDDKVVADIVQREGGKPMDWATFVRGHPTAALQ